MLGREITFQPVPLEVVLTRVPPFMGEYLKLAATTENAIPQSDDTLKLTGRHVSFEEWVSRPEIKAKFE